MNIFCYTTWWAWNDKRLPLFECAGCITVQQWNRPAHPHLSSHRGAGEAEGSKISEARWESSAQRGSPGGGAGRILHIWVAIIRDASSPAPTPPQKKKKYYVDICKTTNRTFLHVFTSQHMTGMTANNCTSLQTLCTTWCFLRKPNYWLMKCSLNVKKMNLSVWCLHGYLPLWHFYKMSHSMFTLHVDVRRWRGWWGS